MSKKIIICGVIGAVLAAVCICVAAAGLLFYLGSRDSNNSFTLIKEFGKVSYKKDGSDGYVELKDDQITLPNKTYVKTEIGNSHIILPDNSLISLDSKTEMQVVFTNNKIDINQFAGNTWHRVQKLASDDKYVVKTPTVLAAVRGTIFGVNIKTDREEQFTIDGDVSTGLKDSSADDISEGEIAIVKDKTVSVENIPENFKLTVWYSRNKELDKAWQNFDKSSDKDEIIKKIQELSKTLIQEVPYEVNTFLEQKDLNEMKNNNFKINTGFNPPDITGTYRIDNWTVKYDKMGIMRTGNSIATCDYTFADQTKDGRVNVKYTCSSVEDEGSGTGSFVSGNNQCFTIYINQTGNYQGCNYNMPAVISGCMESTGIKGLQYTNLMKTQDNTQTCRDNMMPVGNLRLISIDDSYADKITR